MIKLLFFEKPKQTDILSNKENTIIQQSGSGLYESGVYFFFKMLIS